MSQNTTKFLDVILNWRHVSAPALDHLQDTKVFIRGNHTQDIFESSVSRAAVLNYTQVATLLYSTL